MKMIVASEMLKQQILSIIHLWSPLMHHGRVSGMEERLVFGGRHQKDTSEKIPVEIFFFIAIAAKKHTHIPREMAPVGGIWNVRYQISTLSGVRSCSSSE